MINAPRVGRYFIFRTIEEEKKRKPIVYMNDVGMNEEEMMIYLLSKLNAADHCLE
jgi:hypothetical protein